MGQTYLDQPAAMLADALKEQLCELIERFRRNSSDYEKPDYDEANVRADFVDKFFTLLGWDVTNTAGRSERHRDVVREYRVKINKKLKKPDYSFQAGGYPLFFVEAKKPSVAVSDDASSVFQLRSYGYSAKLPLSILTNFAEFAVYNTGIKIDEKDTVKTARIFYCRFDEFFDKCRIPDYETNFDCIVALFSKEGVLNGNFDRYVSSPEFKRGTTPVDEELLAEVEQWRLTLARSVAKQNPELDTEDINFVVQRIVDRVLFLRIAEDRQIERYENLLRATRGTDVYKRLQKLFIDADDKYNAGLFGRDVRLGKLTVDDKILVSIIAGLYGERCPYTFRAIPIEILGSIYERFLGKTIRLTAGHQAKIEEKPEVRKAGGVYYTPQYIVDYIVQETIGRKFAVPTPLTILDPACGSGSFLIGAYTFLLDTHLTHYTSENNLKKSLKKKLIYAEKGKTDTYRLSIEEKQRILLNSIYGVDIDPIAVEVAKFSLYLKLLENETEETTGELFRPADLKLLPDLDKNILCGNSLIAHDYYHDKNIAVLGDDAMRKIKAFDWSKAFPTIFQKGGFDCVIGNPPWGQKAAKFSKDEKEYYSMKFPAASVGIPDLSRFFIEQSIRLLRSNGIWGQVLPDIILLKNYETTRAFLLDNMTLYCIDHWGKSFKAVNLEVCTIAAKKGRTLGDHVVKIGIRREDVTMSGREIRQSVFSELPGKKFNLFLTDASWNLLKNLYRNRSFGEFFDVHEGIHSGNVREKLFVDKKINAKCRKLIFGRDEVQRYHLKWYGKWVHYTKDHFHKNDYAGLGKPEYFECPKLVIRRTGDYVLACIDEEGYYFSNNSFVCIPQSGSIDQRVFLALLNSRLLTWFYRTVQPRVGKMFAEIKINLINDFPVPFGEKLSSQQQKTCQRLASLVDQMLVVQARLHDSPTKLNRKRVQIIDEQIDKLVYELYGLNQKEIGIVERE